MLLSTLSPFTYSHFVSDCWWLCLLFHWYARKHQQSVLYSTNSKSASTHTQHTFLSPHGEQGLRSSLYQSFCNPFLTPALTQQHIHITGSFPTAFKQAWVTRLLKEPTLSPMTDENYRPVSFVSIRNFKRLSPSLTEQCTQWPPEWHQNLTLHRDIPGVLPHRQIF